jgi:Flp pilus assembly protein CpaB
MRRGKEDLMRVSNGAKCVGGLLVVWAIIGYVWLLLPGCAENPASPATAVVAKRSMQRGELIAAQDVAEVKMTRGELPQGFIGGSKGAIGRVLAVPVVEGQPLRQACLKPVGSEARMPVPVQDRLVRFTAVLDTAAISKDVRLRPGCLVDVKFPVEPEPGIVSSVVVLSAVRVLAVEKTGAGGAARAKTRVTFFTASKQVPALQAAVDEGSLSLTLPGPPDGRL